MLLLYPLYLQTYCGFCYEVYIMIFITATSCLSKYMYMHLISTCTQEYNILYIQCIISSYIQVHCYLILYYHTLYCTLVFNSDSCYKCFNSIPSELRFHSNYCVQVVLWIPLQFYTIPHYSTKLTILMNFNPRTLEDNN